MFVNLLFIFDCSVVDFELFGLFLLGYNSGSIRYIQATMRFWLHTVCMGLKLYIVAGVLSFSMKLYA